LAGTASLDVFPFGNLVARGMIGFLNAA